MGHQQHIHGECWLTIAVGIDNGEEGRNKVDHQPVVPAPAAHAVNSPYSDDSDYNDYSKDSNDA